MKFVTALLLIATPLFASAECNPSAPVIHVQAGGLRPGPNGTPPIQDGTPQHPFGDIREAYFFGAFRKDCTVKLQLRDGIYPSVDLTMFNNLEIRGQNRYKTILRGGLYFYGQNTLTVKDVTFQVNSARALLVQGGKFFGERISVSNYKFKPNNEHKKPTAVGFMNAQAKITGLEILGGEQPALRIEGEKSRVSVFGLAVANTKATTHFVDDPSQSNYGAAIEVVNKSLANFMMTDIRNVELGGIFVLGGAQLYAAQIGIAEVKKSPVLNTNVGPHGLAAVYAKSVQLNGVRISYIPMVALLISETRSSVQKAIVAKSEYGLYIARSGPDTGGYDTIKCVTEGVNFNDGNHYPLTYSGYLPVPEAPLPLPPVPGDGPPPPPSPTPTPPPVICPKVERIK